MLRVGAGLGLLMWAGATMVLGRARWFRRAPLVERLRPHVVVVAGGVAPRGSDHLRPIPSLLSLFDAAAARLAGAAGFDEPVAVRLARIGAPLDVAGCRFRQLGWALATAGLAAACAAGTGLSPLPGLVAILGLPIVSCLVTEQRLTAASRAWQRSVERELPVVAEQLAMLVSAGYSTGAAMARIAQRGRGRVATDLGRVGERVRQGLSEAEAVTEWATLADVVGVARLARVLTRGTDSSDLGRLLSGEAQSLRRELHRRVAADAERRAQQVWIPVTVAALVPGVAFLAVPFLHALRAFAVP